MRTTRREFAESFVKECFDRNLSEENTLELFRHAHVADLLQNDQNFAQGFSEELNKRAFFGDLGNTLGFFPKPTTGETVGGGLGFAAGLGMTRKMPGPWWLKVIGASLPALGSAWVGGKFTPRPHADATKMFLPEGLESSNPSSRGGTGNILAVPGTDIYDPRSGSKSSGPRGLTVAGQRMVNANRRVGELNNQIADYRRAEQEALKIPGISGSSRANDFRRSVRELEKEKRVLLDSTSSTLGTMKRQQGQSLRSMDRLQSDALRSRAYNSQFADKMDAWNRSANNNTWWHRLVSRIIGADDRSSQMASQLENIDSLLEQINQNRTQVQNMYFAQ